MTAELLVDGRAVATYVTAPDVDAWLSPRPYLHPVRTLGGVVVSDVLPDDHPHHLGVSLGVQDVEKTNLWGGRTYVRGIGYTWLDDHGRIAHERFDELTQSLVKQRLSWRDPSDAVLLNETRRLVTRPVAKPSSAWALDVTYALAATAGRDVTLGSPATNGRPGGAGYGGFFWRVAPTSDAEVFTATSTGEEQVNGSDEPWLAFASEAFTLVFTGLGSSDRWFVRLSGYPGVCAALAFQRPLAIKREGVVHRHHTVLVADGRLSGDDVAAAVGAAR